jgi:tRNA threonylcarbamoyladenosine biosynthesis protein TsaE
MNHLITNSTEATFGLGEMLGRIAAPGTVVALQGDLGAGKTVFARGVGAGLGITSRVQSPTFVIVQSHEGGRLPFWHADFYRLGSEDELDYLGLSDFLAGGGILVIEWADRFTDWMPEEHLHIMIEHGTPNTRSIRWAAVGESHRALAAALSSA